MFGFPRSARWCSCHRTEARARRTGGFRRSLRGPWDKIQTPGGTTGSDESLDETGMSPGFFASGLDDDRYLESDCRKPQGIHRGELLGMTTPSDGARIETDRAAVLLADVFIDDIERKSPCEPVQHDTHVLQRIVNLAHVAANHVVGEAAGVREGFELLRGLRMVFVAERQKAFRNCSPARAQISASAQR